VVQPVAVGREVRVRRPGEQALGADQVRDHVVHVPAGQGWRRPPVVTEPGQEFGNDRPFLAEQGHDLSHRILRIPAP
jgi:hypothetical protein